MLTGFLNVLKRFDSFHQLFITNIVQLHQLYVEVWLSSKWLNLNNFSIDPQSFFFLVKLFECHSQTDIRTLVIRVNINSFTIALYGLVPLLESFKGPTQTIEAFDTSGFYFDSSAIRLCRLLILIFQIKMSSFISIHFCCLNFKNKFLSF